MIIKGQFTDKYHHLLLSYVFLSLFCDQTVGLVSTVCSCDSCCAPDGAIPLY